jgi:hypothetical protein
MAWPYSRGSEILTIAQIRKKIIYAADVSFQGSVGGTSLRDEGMKKGGTVWAIRQFQTTEVNGELIFK